MRRGINRSSITASAVRCLTGVAPVLHFPATQPKVPRDQQVAKNTAIALSLIKKFKGKAPQAYTRRYSQSFDAVQKEIEALLGSAAKIRKPLTDDQPMDKLTLIERCLRHAMWSYAKDDGSTNFAEMEKWLVYTPTDTTRLNLLRREMELKEKYAAFKKRRAEAGGAQAPKALVDWEQEYTNAIDREIVAEKRLRHDAMQVNTTERDEAKIDALLESYRKPVQDKRLDDLIDLIEKFKPVLAREAIMQRLTIKHLEGQLGIWKYLDWNPEVRDRAELETDNHAPQWWHPHEEGRMVAIRLRSANEVKTVMEKSQSAALAERQTAVASSGKKSKDTAARDKLLAEVLALQARLSRKDDEDEAKKPAAAEAKGHH